MSFLTAVCLNTLFKVVHLNITRVDKALAAFRGNKKVDRVHVSISQVFLNCTVGFGVGVTFEIGERLISKIVVAKGLNGRSEGS
jgi:hypothetical protein